MTITTDVAEPNYAEYIEIPARNRLSCYFIYVNFKVISRIAGTGGYLRLELLSPKMN